MATHETTQMDSAQLYAACGGDDEQAQQAAYQLVWEYLYRIAYHMVYRQPDGPALAQDYAQMALIRIHNQLDKCQEPHAFRGWCRRIVSNIVIDDLRRRRRWFPLPEMSDGTDETAVLTDPAPLPDQVALDELTLTDLRHLLLAAPISERSRRVVIGRFLDGQPDEPLAAIESQLAGGDVRPSHIQVTRTKNMTKLRRWALLRDYLEESQG